MASAASAGQSHVPVWCRYITSFERDLITLAFSTRLKRERDAWKEQNGNFDDFVMGRNMNNAPVVINWAENMMDFPDQRDGLAGRHIDQWRKQYPTSWWDRLGFARAASWAVLTTVLTTGLLQWSAEALVSVVLGSLAVPTGLILGLSVLLWRATRALKATIPEGMVSSIHKIAAAAADLKGSVSSAYNWCKNKILALGWMGVSLCILTVYSLYALVRLYFFPTRDCVVLEAKIEGDKKRVEYKPAPWLVWTENLLVYSTMAMALGSAYTRVTKIVGWHHAFMRVVDFFTGRSHNVEPWWKRLSAEKPMFVRADGHGLGFHDEDFAIPQNSEQASAASNPDEVTFFEKSKTFLWNMIVVDGWQLLLLGVIAAAQYLIYKRMEEIRKQCERLNTDPPGAPAFTYHWFQSHYAKAIKMGATVPDQVATRWAELQAWWKTEKTSLEAQRIRSELERVFKEKQIINDRRREEEKAAKIARNKAAQAEKQKKDQQKVVDKKDDSDRVAQLLKKIAELEKKLVVVAPEAKGKNRGASQTLSDQLTVNDIRQDVSDSRAARNEKLYEDALDEARGDGRHAQAAQDFLERNQGVPFNSAAFRAQSMLCQHEGLLVTAKVQKKNKKVNFPHVHFLAKDWNALTGAEKKKLLDLNQRAIDAFRPHASAAVSAASTKEAMVTKIPIQTVAAHSLMRIVANLSATDSKASAAVMVEGMVCTVKHAFTPTDELTNMVPHERRVVLDHKFNEVKVTKWFDHPELDLSFGSIHINTPPSIKRANTVPKSGDVCSVYMLQKTLTGVSSSSGEVRGVTDTAVQHSCNTVPGWSGAPVISDSKLVAIHQGAAGANNTAVLLSPKVISEAKSALGLALN